MTRGVRRSAPAPHLTTSSADLVGEFVREPVAMAHHALLAGATGLVGGHVLRLLLADPAFLSVVAPARRPLAVAAPKLVEGIIDFDALDALALPPLTDFFCCLGTTIKQAGSEAAFARVDHDYPVALARHALAAGAKRCYVVSSLGADVRSKVFYNRVKGEVERDLAALPFEGVVAFRPSLLAGDRAEFRLGERLALAALSPLGRLVPARLRPIEAAVVARAMVAVARRAPGGRLVIESDAIRTIAASA